MKKKRTNKLNGNGKSVENMLTATLQEREGKKNVYDVDKKEFQHVDRTILKIETKRSTI